MVHQPTEKTRSKVSRAARNWRIALAPRRCGRWQPWRSQAFAHVRSCFGLSGLPDRGISHAPRRSNFACARRRLASPASRLLKGYHLLDALAFGSSPIWADNRTRNEESPGSFCRRRVHACPGDVLSDFPSTTAASWPASAGAFATERLRPTARLSILTRYDEIPPVVAAKSAASTSSTICVAALC